MTSSELRVRLANQEQLVTGICEAHKDGEPECAASTLARPIVVVDVRSPPERSVSAIPTSISLCTFHQEVAPNLPPNADVVTYCTIGLRSGMEARRIQDRYGLTGRVYNLDGIVSYTHTSSQNDDRRGDMCWDEADGSVAVDQSANNSRRGGDSSSSILSVPRLVKPNTNIPTCRVHTFGPTWDCVDEHFEPTHFSPPVLLIRIAGVGVKLSVRRFQRLVHKFKGTCGVCCSSLRDGVAVDEHEPDIL